LGAVFTFRVQLEELTFAQHVSFMGARLEGGCEFRSCRFEGGLSLDYADFDDAVAIFQHCAFDKGLSSWYGHMDMNRQHLAFVACEIGGDVRMTGFCGDLRFDECRIRGSLNLDNAYLSHLSLTDLRLTRQLDSRDMDVAFLRAPNAVFEAATTIGPFTAKSSDFSDASFGSRVQIGLKGERVSFRNAVWQRGGRLEVEDADVNLEGLVLGAPLALVGAGSAALVSMRDADAGSLSVSKMDLSRCIFRGAHRLQEISADSTVTLPPAPGPLRTRRRCLADEFGWRARYSRWRRKDWKIPGTVLEPNETSPDALLLPDLSAAEVAGVYRALRKALESGADEPGASDFYYGEMEMRRLDKTTSRAERLIVSVYWLVAGYGLRGTRALGWLFLALFAGSLVLLSVGLKTPDPSLADAFLTAVEGAIPGVPTSVELTMWGRVVDLLLMIVGPVLLGLGALALRNRVKR
jgi:uncharacterized protein YjbI with pentapeptide repeats